MHWYVNVVCGPVGYASAVLLRAGGGRRRRPWRFWLAGEPTVSVYHAHKSVAR